MTANGDDFLVLEGERHELSEKSSLNIRRYLDTDRPRDDPKDEVDALFVSHIGSRQRERRGLSERQVRRSIERACRELGI